MTALQCLFILSSIGFFTHCARIFGVFPVPAISHLQVYQSIYKELSRRGHEVIVVTPNPVNDSSLTNLTEIDVSYLYKHSSFAKDEMNSNYVNLIYKVNIYLEFLSELILQDERVKAIYADPSEKFDAVLVEHFTPFLHVFGTIFKTPVIGLTSLDAFMGTHMALGNPVHPLYYSDGFLPISDKSLSQKIWRAFCFCWTKWHHNFVVYPRCNKLAKKYFGNHTIHLEDEDSKTSLLLINSNNFISPIRPISSNVVTFGFAHLKTEKLPLDLQGVLDKATNGVIYMSLGSNVKSSTLPPELIQIIIQTFSELPYTILWKWEADNIPGIGKNIVTRKWFPQQEILAHPNVKVFVTQGGLQSIEEAISRAVPMIGIPFIADQVSNVDRIAQLGIGLKLDAKTITTEKLKDAILNVAQNSEYLEKIKNIRDIALDQPMTGLEKAVWWIEYVMRHKGAKHLRSAVAGAPLWEYLMLDVIAVVSAVFIISGFVLYKLIFFVVKKIKRVYFGKCKSA